MRFVAVQILIEPAAIEAHFLGPEPHHPDRAKRPSGIHHLLCRRRGDGDSGAVVDCPGAEIPTVEMPAHEKYRSFGVAPRHFGNDIARIAWTDRGNQRQAHGHRLAALQDALELFGVRDRERRGRDGRDSVLERLPAGVRIAVMVGTDRADDNRQRALCLGSLSERVKQLANRGHGPTSRGPGCVNRSFKR